MKRSVASTCKTKQDARANGFSLIEVVIALVVLFVAILGVFAAFTYSTTYNTGNSRRSQALSVLQKEVELLRSAKFLPQPIGADSVTASPTADDGRRDLTGGVKPARAVRAADGTTHMVEIVIDDDPYTGGVQVDPTKHLKEIRVTVTPRGSDPTSWEVGYRTTAIFRRARSN